MALNRPYGDEDCELEEGCDPQDFECEKAFVECICPKCGIRHKLKMCWTGWGVPRKFCNACRKSSLIYDDVEEFISLHTVSE